MKVLIELEDAVLLKIGVMAAKQGISRKAYIEAAVKELTMVKKGEVKNERITK